MLNWRVSRNTPNLICHAPQKLAERYLPLCGCFPGRNWGIFSYCHLRLCQRISQLNQSRYSKTLKLTSTIHVHRTLMVYLFSSLLLFCCLCVRVCVCARARVWLLNKRQPLEEILQNKEGRLEQADHINRINNPQETERQRKTSTEL